MRFSGVMSLLIVCCLQCQADDWSHWRGPNGSGAALTGNPPTEWNASKNIKWKVRVPGAGSGSPVIQGDKVFVATAVPAESAGGTAPAAEAPTQPAPSGQRQRRGGGRSGRRGGSRNLQTLDFFLICYDRRTGEKVWERKATTAKPHQGTHPTNGFASASPCTDGEHVYAHFGSRGLFCYSMDGEPKWERTDFEPMSTRNSFGEGSSPTIAGDMILLPWDHEGQSFLYALNKRTGKTVWETKRDEPTEWSTPLVVGNQVILNGQVCARGYDLKTGKELWRCSGQTDRPAASAVHHDGLVIVGSGFRGSYMGAFRLTGRGDLAGTRSVAWSISQDTPDIASPLLSGGRLYFHKGKTGILTCVDAASGEKHFGPSRISGISSTYASPVAAGGHVYLTGRSGTTVVIRDSEELEIVSTNSVGEGVDATPAPVGDELFIRGAQHLFCISEK